METVNNGVMQDADEFAKAEPVPKIEREPQRRIIAGNGGKLVVPREEIFADVDVGSDMDLAAMQAKKIRRPDRREWIALNVDAELQTRLLRHKAKPDSIETEYYYVVPELRAPILSELKECRIFTYYSFSTKTHSLWIVHVTPDNSWYESVNALFKHSDSFFRENAIRVMSDKDNNTNRVRYKAMPSPVTWPSTTTEELLGEALGPERFITTADHPLYRDLIDGVELT